MNLIGMQGKAGAGKDHVSLAIKENIEGKGLTCEIISFSDFVRENAAKMMSLDYDISLDEARNRCNDPENKDRFYDDINTTPRKFTCFESDKAKEYNPLCFIQAWKEAVKKSNAEVVINPSIRTPEEADAIIESKGFMFRVVNNCMKYNDEEAHFTESIIENHPVEIITNDWNEETQIQCSLNFDKHIEDISTDLIEYKTCASRPSI